MQGGGPADRAGGGPAVRPAGRRRKPQAVQTPGAERRKPDESPQRPPGPPAREPARPAKDARPGGRTSRPQGPRYARPLTTASLIGWTALSAVIPGAAHLRAGRRRTGFVLLGVFGAVLLALMIFALRVRNDLSVVLSGGTLTALMIGAAVCALAWFALVAVSFIALRPQRLSQAGQIVSGVVAGLLCVSVMAPFAFAANTVKTASELLDAVTAPVEGAPTPSAVRAEDPWNGRKRINFLLVGGDAAGNRIGVRTDSMTVASVNLATGNTVLFSLPRNLQYVRFPPSSPLHKQFPNGFTAEGQGLLNSVWYYADNNPQIMGGKNRGAQALKDAIGYTLGLHIDYYAMIDMYGFAALIDAVGGLKIRVQQDVKWGGTFGTAGTIKAGFRTLNGEEVLWYGRSRVGSDDFSRMARQRCVIGALAHQVTPARFLANFTKIAAAARHMVRTDIPRDLLPHLVPLGMKVRNAKITSLQFVPPVIYPGNPDWQKIRKLTRQAILESMSDRRAVTVSASARASATPAATPTTGVTVSKRPQHTPTGNDRAAKSLEELCGF